ncbi:pseudouridine synthase [Candidatus Phycosocius spiralis]|uniref:Pseudouridine synthase n=2 Tax=Candidatus Phycosocius spiralis TaxID=2815099 RepID=A0ABQ4PWS8_9PROT|nr:pseudouridine synthase [Candidatus Phycosocius spiralis]GIU67431.1 pseudouridine synthase [Candidatus Phycosocius spiralis]
MRLDRLLANMGYGSRREIALMVKAGWVVLDGITLEEGAVKLALSDDLPKRLLLRGNAIDPLPGMVLMVHKPLGYTCSHKEAGKLIYDLLPERWRAREPVVSTIGRLDKDTSGLILMTDDGELLHKIISPKHHIPKRYVVGLDRSLSGQEAPLFASGTMMLEGEDKPLLPAHLVVTSERTAVLTLFEGRYHQVRRMFAAIGNHVVSLHRDQIGDLMLPTTLAVGSFVVLTPQETAQIFSEGPNQG